MILDTVSNNPQIGFGGAIGSALIHYLGVINPILSFISLLIGIFVGLTTLYLQITKIRK